MMKTKILIPALLVVSMSFASCARMGDITYISNAERNIPIALQDVATKSIQPNDLLNIYVESETPAATIRFNQETNKVVVDEGNVGGQVGNVPGYLVNQEGDIVFPILGKIHVAGLTHEQLAIQIESRLISEGHINDPVVTVKLMNFKVSVLGEVAKPSQVSIQGERVTIFEALSMVGDMTIYGQRQNVMVLREENGVRVVGSIDLSSKDAFESPYYYLRQNDVIYVEPNRRMKKNAERDYTTLSTISSIASIISVGATVFYYYLLSQRYSNR